MSTTTSPPPRLVRDTPFGRYLLARGLVTIGAGVTYIALPVLAYRISGSASAPALVAACETAPYIVLGPIAGVLGDRWDRRRIMVTTDVLGALVVALLPIAFHFAALTLFQVVATAFVIASLQVIFDGAAFGAVPALVGRERVTEANARLWSALSAADSTLPAIVGTALAYVHPADLVSLNAITFVASARLISTLTVIGSADGGPGTKLTLGVVARDIQEGLRFLVNHVGIRFMTLVSVLQCFAIGGLAGLLIPLADQRLGIGASGPRFGALYAALGLGAFGASLLLPRVVRHVSTRRLASWTLPGLAVVQAGTVLASVWWLAALCMCAWSALFTVTMLASASYRQQETPDRLQGRVNTVGRMLAVGFGTTGGTLTAGALVGSMGIATTLAIICVVGGLAIPLALTVRGLDEPA